MVYAYKNLSGGGSSEIETICVNLMDLELKPPLPVEFTTTSLLDAYNQPYVAISTTDFNDFKNILVTHK